VEVFSTKDKVSAVHWTADPRRIDTLYFFPDGKNLFVGPVDSPGQVWELTDTPTLRATLPVDFGGIPVCAVSPDGKLLVAAGDDTVIRWYDTATWQKTREYRSFTLETFALKFTPDGKSLLAGGADSRITVLDVASGKEVRQLPPEPGSSIAAIEMMGGSQRVATVYFDNAGEKPPHVLLWDLASTKSVPVKSDSPATCGGVVGGKLWMCTSDGKMLTISQRE
jgi:WD40 repeat protein